MPKHPPKPGLAKVRPRKLSPAMTGTSDAVSVVAAPGREIRPVTAPGGLGRRLFYGDNLAVLRKHVDHETVDLIYLDPPFKSNQDYNVLFKDRAGQRSSAQMSAFEDTWTWDEHSEAAFQESLAQGGDLADALIALRHILRQSDMMAYVAMMAPRLIELRRVLKSTGSIYLHCDPTSSHYLKLLLDAVFGVRNFRSEVIWKRSFAHSGSRRYAPVHDCILFYTKSEHYTWNPIYQPLPEGTADAWYNNVEPETGKRYNRADLTAAGVRSGSSGMAWKGIDPTAKGRHWAIPRFAREIVADMDTIEALDALDAAGRIHWPKKRDGTPMFKRYLSESKGVPAQDIISDITMNNIDAERLGYPTQKPVALLERLIESSSNEGDLVLDPFCGCGTTVAAAEGLRRAWIGIDVAFLAVDLIEKRLRAMYGDDFTRLFSVTGIPEDLEGARALFQRNPLDFQVWAVSLVDGQPNEKKSGDRGVDGRILFPVSDRSKVGSAVISVKGGHQLNPAMVRELVGAVRAENADMGLLIVMSNPTRGMLDAARSGGIYTWPVNGRSFPKIQIATIEDMLAGGKPNMPQALLPYVKARAHSGTQLDLLAKAQPISVKPRNAGKKTAN